MDPYLVMKRPGNVVFMSCSRPVLEALPDLVQGNFQKITVFIPRDFSEEKNLHETLVHIKNPGIILLDISSLQQGGLALLKGVCIHFPQVPVVVLHEYSQELFAQSLIAAGAKAFLPVNTTSEALEKTLTAIMEGTPFSAN